MHAGERPSFAIDLVVVSFLFRAFYSASSGDKTVKFFVVSSPLSFLFYFLRKGSHLLLALGGSVLQLVLLEDAALGDEGRAQVKRVGFH